MFVTCGIHQEQLRRVKESFRELYHYRKTEDTLEPEHGAGSGRKKPVHASTEFVVPDRGPRRLRRAMKPPVRLTPGAVCPCCGEMFPEVDLRYTEFSGLCISCWEKGVV